MKYTISASSYNTATNSSFVGGLALLCFLAFTLALNLNYLPEEEGAHKTKKFEKDLPEKTLLKLMQFSSYT